jgi:Uma2 family endonuclease
MAVRALISAEEAPKLAGAGRWELVRGEVVRMSPSGGPHGEVTARVVELLAPLVRARWPSGCSTRGRAPRPSIAPGARRAVSDRRRRSRGATRSPDSR